MWDLFLSYQASLPVHFSNVCQPIVFTIGAWVAEREWERARCCYECWSTLGSSDVTHCDVTQGEDRPRGGAGRSDRQRNYSSSPLTLPPITCMTRTCTTFKSERNFKIFYTCYVTCWALTTVHKHSHLWLLWQQPQAQPASHLHITGNTVTPSPTHCYYLSVSCRLPTLNMSLYSSMKETKTERGKKMKLSSCEYSHSKLHLMSSQGNVRGTCLWKSLPDFATPTFPCTIRFLTWTGKIRNATAEYQQYSVTLLNPGGVTIAQTSTCLTLRNRLRTYATNKRNNIVVCLFFVFIIAKVFLCKIL